MRKFFTDQYHSKFDHPFTAYLYGCDPDQETGDSSEGSGWFGLYGRNIVVEETTGAVHRTKYPTRDAATVAFLQIECQTFVA